MNIRNMEVVCQDHKTNHLQDIRGVQSDYNIWKNEVFYNLGINDVDSVKWKLCCGLVFPHKWEKGFFKLVNPIFFFYLFSPGILNIEDIDNAIS